MLDKKLFDDVAKRLSEAVPTAVREAGQDIEKTFRSILQNAFAKLDLVTREEFDVQTAVLSRTREKLEQLEKQVSALEVKAGITQYPPTAEPPTPGDDVP